MKAILKTDNLSIGYSAKSSKNVIASAINISLSEGKLISLIGVNGIGKSTLLRTISGIQKPLEGKVFFNNKDIRQFNSIELAQHLSLVLTEKLPSSNLSVFELVALGRQPYTNWLGTLTTNDREKVDIALKITESDTYAERKHYEISDGQMQKVLVARALAQDTPLIILDEPGTHLDLQNKVSLFKLLKRLAHESGKCILFSTHDIDMAIQLSDDMIIMQENSVVQATPQEFIEDHTFNLLFKDEDILFDKEKVKFVFKNL
ncbi:MAG TPA: ABC transporter ATP-binding protein [Flavobacterium sp.]